VCAIGAVRARASADVFRMQVVTQRVGERWVGYGRWEAPYWFVGVEPAHDDDRATHETWRAAVLPALDAVRGEAIVDPLWSTLQPPAERAYAEFSRLVLGFEDAPSGMRDIARDQRERLGHREGPTLLVDLPADPATRLRAPTLARLTTLSRRMREHEPRFVVFYGTAYRAAFQAIAGTTFDDTGYVRCGKSLCTLVRHPAARPALPTAWWGAKGRQLRLLT